MTHRPVYFPSKFAGIALTVHLKKEENDDCTALKWYAGPAIDSGQRDSVYVMEVDDGADIAGMGGRWARPCPPGLLLGRSSMVECAMWPLAEDWVSRLCPGHRAVHIGPPLSFRVRTGYL